MAKFYTLIIVTIFFNQCGIANTLDSLKRRLKKSIRVEEKATIYNDIGTIYGSQGDFNNATKYFVESAKILEQLNDTIRLYKRYINLGSMFIQIKQERKGLKYCNKAKKILQANNDTLVLSLLLTNMGVGYYNLGEYHTALEHYNQAYKLQLAIKDSLNATPTIMNIGIIYDINKDYLMALKYYHESLDIANSYLSRVNSQQEKMLLTSTIESCNVNLGSIYTSIKQYEDALFYLNKTINNTSEFTSIRAKMDAYMGLLKVYKKKKEYKKALDIYDIYINIKDSVLNVANLEKINEVSIKYETDKKRKKIEF